jgi:hypothetical protein
MKEKRCSHITKDFLSGRREEIFVTTKRIHGLYRNSAEASHMQNGENIS